MAAGRIIRWRGILVATAVSGLVWAAPTQSSEPIGPIEVTVCQLALHGDRYDGKLIRVTARPQIGVEFFRLYSRNCPDSSLIVGHTAVDLSGCDDKTVMEKYGCPLNPETGVRVTLTGKFRFKHLRDLPSIGSIDVTSVAFIPGDPVARTHGT